MLLVIKKLWKLITENKQYPLNLISVNNKIKHNALKQAQREDGSRTQFSSQREIISKLSLHFIYIGNRGEGVHEN